MKDFLDAAIKGKHILILGMGVEGKSTYRLLRKLYPEQTITIADRRRLDNDPEFNNNLTLIRQGEQYLNELDQYDLIIKSPGISLGLIAENVDVDKITSQTELFLKGFRDRTIGITGTKGKSTTATLIHHLLKSAGYDALLVGNIGLPPFEVADQINEGTLIVFELSSHQLEGIQVSPHVSVLLNIYQEHLDHYKDFKAYQLAKYTIAKWHGSSDFLVYHQHDALINQLIHENKPASILVPFSLQENPGAQTYLSDNTILSRGSEILEQLCDLSEVNFLAGKHNILNLMAALTACRLAGANNPSFCDSLKDFRGLEHRMEFFGEFGGVRFYNDSIATIPEAVIFAIQTIGDVDTLILGGYDRGIDYSQLIEYLGKSDVRNLFFTGEAGKRLANELKNAFPGQHNYQWFDEFDAMVMKAITVTTRGRSCLLSPAAASYDKFMNFEHRGNRFKTLVKNWFEPKQ